GRGIRSFEECSSTTYAGPVNRGRVYLFLALANLFWAGNYVFGEMVTREVSPLSLTFFPWGFAFLPLLAIAWLIERPNWRERCASGSCTCCSRCSASRATRC